MLLKFGIGGKDHVSFARLSFGGRHPEPGNQLPQSHDEIASKVATSLNAGGSGAELLDLEWPYQQPMSLGELAKSLDTKLGATSTIEIPGIATVGAIDAGAAKGSS